MNNMIYDPEANIISWEVSKGQISQAKEFGNIVIHLSPAGKPVLIEILEATKYVGQLEKIKNIKEIKKIVPAGN
jgi:uncharacterized protein YuzE